MGTNKSKAYYKATTTDASQIAYEMEGINVNGVEGEEEVPWVITSPFPESSNYLRQRGSKNGGIHERIMKLLDHNRNLTTPQRASSKRSYVIPEMTASDV